MILSELNNVIVRLAQSSYLVNEAFVGDVYEINAKENRFGCFVATPMTAQKNTYGTIRYRYVMYYVDRLVKDESNIDFVQSDAVFMLKGLLSLLEEKGVDIESGYEFVLFRHNFSDWCAGAYVTVTMTVPDNDCSEDTFDPTVTGQIIPIHITQNGTYTPNPGDGYGPVEVCCPTVSMDDVDEEIDNKLSGFIATSTSLGGVYVGPGLMLDGDGRLTPKTGDVLDTLLEVNEGGYLAVNPWILRSNIEGLISTYSFATESWVTSNFISSAEMSGYATESWVQSQGYLTSVSLSGYVTESWVNSQQFVTESWVSSQQFVTESWVNSQGYMSASDMSDYLLKTYTSGSVSMMFGPELPYIYLQSSAGNLNARVNLLTMRNTSGYFTQQTPLGYTAQYSSQRAGIWYDADYSSAVLGVRDGGLGLAIDTRNIYLTDNYSSTVIPISDLATQTWTSSNYFATSQLWTGTSSQWAALTPEQQAFYTIALITE